MLTKIKGFMNKPVTWGGYLKLAGVSMVLGLAYSVIALVRYGLFDTWIESIEFMNPFRKKGYDNTEEES